MPFNTKNNNKQIYIDIIIIFILLFFVYAISGYFDFYEKAIGFINRYEKYELDELAVTSIIATLALCVFSFRRWNENNKTNQRLEKNQDFLNAARREIKHRYETQSIVSQLLGESLGNASIKELLDKCLGLVLSLPWLTIESKGCIFLVEEDPEILVMKSHHGLSDELKKACKRVPFGDCLCGKAALTKSAVFSNHLDTDHTYSFKGMEEHGHYCVPIIAKDKLLGVFNIYVKHGHEKKEFEEVFLMTIANTLAGILIQRRGEEEKKKAEGQLHQSQKLESIGQLAAGIAHEINTPIQYIGDNTNFLKGAFKDMNTIVNGYGQLLKASKKGRIDDAIINIIESVIDAADLSFLKQEIPSAIEQTLEGIERVSKIVTSMKEFSHPGGDKKVLVDINHALENTITIAGNEWKYLAELKTDFDDSLPLVMGNPGELNQVFLNMITNASYSIADALKDKSGKKGVILIRTSTKEGWARISISDTGKGIPEEIQNKIFDPFFTTKDVGKGTGQGLAISYSFIVDNHNGNLSYETLQGKGTTFIIELPVQNQK